jgi:hypothetical protein
MFKMVLYHAQVDPVLFHRNEADTLALASNPFLGLEHTPAGDKLPAYA